MSDLTAMLPNLILTNPTNPADSQKYPPHSTRRSQSGVVQLEWPEEVGSIFELGTNSDDLVDQILNADDSELAKL